MTVLLATGIALACLPSAPAAAAAIDKYVRAVREAPDPSVAVEAFSAGLAVDRRSAKLHDAYVRRMVEFGAPDLAAEQARTLIELDRDNALGWGVVAYAEAQAGEMADAIYAIARAVDEDDDEPFILNTAGQLLAWYDAQPKWIAFPEKARIAAEEVRDEVDDEEAFIDGYRAASRALEGEPPAAKVYEDDDRRRDTVYVYRSYTFYPYRYPRIVFLQTRPKYFLHFGLHSPSLILRFGYQGTFGRDDGLRHRSLPQHPQRERPDRDRRDERDRGRADRDDDSRPGRRDQRGTLFQRDENPRDLLRRLTERRREVLRRDDEDRGQRDERDRSRPDRDDDSRRREPRRTRDDTDRERRTRVSPSGRSAPSTSKARPEGAARRTVGRSAVRQPEPRRNAVGDERTPPRPMMRLRSGGRS